MIMKSLTYENSPILVNFVASTYFVTLGPDAVGISNEKYIDTGQYKRTIINLSYYQVSYFYISKTASLPLCYNVLKLMNIFFSLPFRLRWLAERESLRHFTFDSPAYPPPTYPPCAHGVGSCGPEAFPSSRGHHAARSPLHGPHRARRIAAAGQSQRALV